MMRFIQYEHLIKLNSIRVEIEMKNETYRVEYKK